MPTVETVRGAVDVADLGPTLMHEHVFVVGTEHVQNYGDTWWDEEERVADAVARLRSVAARGVRTFVDPTVWGIGRDIPRVQRINEQVPELNIVVASGYYDYADAPLPFHLRGPGLMFDETPDPLGRLFVRDITEGIAGTGVKAAFLKCAVERPDPSPGVERVLRAVAYAHRETGAPISTHTDPNLRRGLEQQRIFTEEGVDLTRVVIGHSGDTDDLDYLQALLDNGSYLGMDRFGLDSRLSFDRRVKTIDQVESISGVPGIASLPLVGLRELSRITKRGRDELAR